MSARKPKPFLNLICDRASWTALLDVFHEEWQRFSRPDRYVQELIDRHGRPLFVSTEAFDCHIYPPGME